MSQASAALFLRTQVTEQPDGTYTFQVINDMEGKVEYVRAGLGSRQRAMSELMNWVHGRVGAPLAVDKGGLFEPMQIGLYRSK